MLIRSSKSAVTPGQLLSLGLGPEVELVGKLQCAKRTGGPMESPGLLFVLLLLPRALPNLLSQPARTWMVHRCSLIHGWFWEPHLLHQLRSAGLWLGGLKHLPLRVPPPRLDTLHRQSTCMPSGRCRSH